MSDLDDEAAYQRNRKQVFDGLTEGVDEEDKFPPLIRLATNETCAPQLCDLCPNDIDESIDDVANHYILHHGYQVAHVGPETSGNPESGLFHHTVIVLSRQS